jgi:hypothetical protein
MSGFTRHESMDGAHDDDREHDEESVPQRHHDAERNDQGGSKVTGK